MEALNQRALDAGIPLSAHIDLTWRCNERCIHCYLNHDDAAELTLHELRNLLNRMAEAGVFFLTFSGGEIFLRSDLEQIVAHARALSFNIKLKTNAILIGPAQAAWISRLGVHQVQVSIYSHRPEIHDAITKVRGSLERSLRAIARLREQGVHVIIACVLMTQNARDFEGVRQLAADLGVEFTLDPTITPHLDDYDSLKELNIGRDELTALFHNQAMTGNADICAPPPPVDDDALESLPCSAGHTSCYISPHGDLWPCVQFPIVCGNVRNADFSEIWEQSPQLHQVRAIRARNLTVCSSCGHVGSCTRCPGLAYMEGSMYGPSSADCEKSYARTGVLTANMKRRQTLVQIAS